MPDVLGIGPGLEHQFARRIEGAREVQHALGGWILGGGRHGG
jgi:hypothetical protein